MGARARSWADRPEIVSRGSKSGPEGLASCHIGRKRGGSGRESSSELSCCMALVPQVFELDRPFLAAALAALAFASPLIVAFLDLAAT